MPGARASRGGTILIWAGLGLVLLFLYAPLVPPAVHSFADTTAGGAGPFRTMLPSSTMRACCARFGHRWSWASLVALIAPALALLAAEAVRVWRLPRLIIAIMLLPLFVPGVSMGLATGLFFQILGIQPSLLTITTVQVIWALPFAFLIILTVMANFDQVYLEAAHMSGAGRVRAFLEVELPQIHQGILGAAVFSLIISFNETIRTSVVQGGRNTVPTYLWSQYQQVGLSPQLFALMTLIIALTLALIALVALLEGRQRRAA